MCPKQRRRPGSNDVPSWILCEPSRRAGARHRGGACGRRRSCDAAPTAVDRAIPSSPLRSSAPVVSGRLPSWHSASALGTTSEGAAPRKQSCARRQAPGHRRDPDVAKALARHRVAERPKRSSAGWSTLGDPKSGCLRRSHCRIPPEAVISNGAKPGCESAECAWIQHRPRFTRDFRIDQAVSCESASTEVRFLAISTSLIATGSAPAFVLPRVFGADGVRVAAFVPGTAV